MDKTQLVIDSIEDIRKAPIGVETETEYRKLIKKYDMIFMGESFNTITSLEFAHYLKNQKDPSINHDFILEVLPKLAKKLNIELESQIKMDDIGKTNPPVANYLIRLF